MFILIENCVTLALLKSIQNGNFSSLNLAAIHMYAMRTCFLTLNWRLGNFQVNKRRRRHIIKSTI